MGQGRLAERASRTSWGGVNVAAPTCQGAVPQTPVSWPTLRGAGRPRQCGLAARAELVDAAQSPVKPTEGASGATRQGLREPVDDDVLLVVVV